MVIIEVSKPEAVPKCVNSVHIYLLSGGSWKNIRKNIRIKSNG